MDRTSGFGSPGIGAGKQVRLPPVLMYHSISPSRQPDPHQLRIHPDRLDAHLRLLRRFGLRGVPLRQLLQARRPRDNRGLVGLTFDDGYRDFSDHAAPVLAQHGMSATVYVVAGRVGGVNDWDDGPVLPLMDAEQVRTAATAGHEVGSHTLTHPRLTTVDAVTLTTEVEGSRRVLENLLQSEIPGFCYPWGSFNEAARTAARDAGYQYACATGDWSPGDLMAIPRCYVSPADRAAHLVARMARHHLKLRSTRTPSGGRSSSS